MLKALAMLILAAGCAGLVRAEIVNLDEELQDQFETLQHDLARRAVFLQRTGETFRADALILAADRDPADVALRRTAALLADVQQRSPAGRCAAFARQLAGLQQKSAATAATNDLERRALFGEVCRLRRQIAFANPLLNFDQLVFIKRHRALYNHMCDQFYGLAATPGGGLYILEKPFSSEPRVRDVLANAVVEKGR